MGQRVDLLAISGIEPASMRLELPPPNVISHVYRVSWQIRRAGVFGCVRPKIKKGSSQIFRARSSWRNLHEIRRDVTYYVEKLKTTGGVSAISASNPLVYTFASAYSPKLYDSLAVSIP